MFSALDFILDGKMLSQFDGWFIQNISTNTRQKSGGEVKIYQDFVMRKSKPIFQGATYQGNKRFDVRIGKSTQTDEFEVAMIRNWLEGVLTYKPIVFIQNDLIQYHMNVIIESVETAYIGNQPAYMILSMTCDSPFAYEAEKTIQVPNGATSFTLYNSSALNDYTYPIVKFQKVMAGNFKITNTSDNSRNFIFTNLTDGEMVTVDNDKQIITGNLVSNLLGNFNKRWFRLVKGENNLTFTGSFSNLQIIYANVVQVL